GYTLDDVLDNLLTRDLDALDALDAPTLPPGYRLAIVDTPERLIGRVEAHRVAFGPSELTRRQYERVQRTWPYRRELDQIVETDTGDVVAFCTTWIDEENAAGLLEPVGALPSHQRRGLATAACRAGLIALRAAGARTAQVACSTLQARALYESLGFTLVSEDTCYSKALP
ncbi:MAG: GNAT family N-acetyltransferase, partial [Thermomicrobiales bacterium]